jgi:hypothetical protein
MNDKKNQYNTIYSSISDGRKEDQSGIAYNIYAGKTGGRFNFQFLDGLSFSLNLKAGITGSI